MCFTVLYLVPKLMDRPSQFRDICKISDHNLITIFLAPPKWENGRLWVKSYFF